MIQSKGGGSQRTLKRLKSISMLCSRINMCSFCHAQCLNFKQQGLCILAKATNNKSHVMVPPVVVHSILMKLPLMDLEVLGFPVKTVENSHPIGCILSVLPVLPPVSRPAMRTLNLKTGQPFIVEDFSGACCYFFFFLKAPCIRKEGQYHYRISEYSECHQYCLHHVRSEQHLDKIH